MILGLIFCTLVDIIIVYLKIFFLIFIKLSNINFFFQK
jgi:hypothetical protein